MLCRGALGAGERKKGFRAVEGRVAKVQGTPYLLALCPLVPCFVTSRGLCYFQGTPYLLALCPLVPCVVCALYANANWCTLKHLGHCSC
jgi:hypothetical protein